MVSYLLLLLPGPTVPKVPAGIGTNTTACILAQSQAKLAHSTAKLLWWKG